MILEIIFLFLGIPLGLWIAWITRDEIVIGRKWLRVLVIAGIIGGIGFSLMNEGAEALTSFFISIVSLVSYTKSFDRKWTK